MGGDGIQCGKASVDNSSRCAFTYIGNCHFYDNRENSVDIKETDYLVVSSSTLHGTRNTVSSDGGVIIAHNGCDNVWLINNIVHNSTWGIYNTGCTNFMCIGNIVYNIHDDGDPGWNPDSFYDNAHGAAFRLDGTSTGVIINNTLADYDIGVLVSSLGSGNEWTIRNNYFNGQTPANGHDISWELNADQINTTVEHNIYRTANDANRFLIASSYKTLAQMQALGNCVNDQLEVASSIGVDYTLNNGSPAINAGKSIADIQAQYYAAFGVNLSKDLFGNNRVQGAAIDIGAHEKQ
jgi:hypothetical protein